MPLPWPYVVLDPDVTAKRAYDLYPKGHCMYAVFGSVVYQLAEKIGAPYVSFPVEMMSYGLGGLAKWGSLCGALNGAAALFSLLARNVDERQILTQELFRWYEQTALPKYASDAKSQPKPFPVSVAGSVDCHISANRWCKSSGFVFGSPERVERCKRLSCDVAHLSVEMLNAAHAGSLKPQYAVDAGTAQCQSCHGDVTKKTGAFGEAACSACHTSVARHEQQLKR